jgi:hypothetical protein
MSAQGKYPPVKWNIMREIAISLPHRDWSFDALLARVDHPHHERKPGMKQLGLGVTHAHGSAKGVTKSALGQSRVREYAFIDLRNRTLGDPEDSYAIWRVFVRNERVLYMEYTTLRVSKFNAYYSPVN